MRPRLLPSNNETNRAILNTIVDDDQHFDN